ncbi:hypothetical protein CLOHYLEM_06542 [[Clostridium] hylemonae DSM 15053]|uniref:Uncharacterized protein n=1 Tax=[Clostridium] hylemonae DSM 15053 TaxID=553973 RepID=C0C382_9FIRM|nr:hypothetical protein CLOHYLEM_06542 [[Clostridium] hylemonae DSM 15053]
MSAAVIMSAVVLLFAHSFISFYIPNSYLSFKILLLYQRNVQKAREFLPMAGTCEKCSQNSENGVKYICAFEKIMHKEDKIL